MKFIAILLICTSTATVATAAPLTEQFDVVVYGATPGGIAAAVSVARRDEQTRVALVTRYRRIGGMVTNGLTHPDFRTFEARTGFFREFNQRVEKSFADQYGADSQEVKDSLLGTHAGPDRNHRVLCEMIHELPGITVFSCHALSKVAVADRRITSADFQTESDTVTFWARYFVDATYEGDLLAAAGVAFRVGREARSEYNESLAPTRPDDQLQGYNFRLTLTDRAENQTPVPKPDGYRREDYLSLLPLLTKDKLQRVFGDPLGGISGGIYKRQTPRLPEGKRDINDISHGLVRLSMPGHNQEWPAGDRATRQRIFDKHVRHNLGMLYFLQNDDAVPQGFQKDARSWQLCRDELVDNNHLPEQLYVREARRMSGRYVFTQADTERAPGTNHARAIFHANAIAMGDYGPNCHGTAHEGPLFGGRHTGECYQKTAPYQIPYGVLLPKEIDNLAVPVACSSSHIGFCALRLEPIWISLGQAAGEAIALSIETTDDLVDLTPASIRERLHAVKAATIYTSDVSEESPDFAAVQWWGSQGGFIALEQASDGAATGEAIPYGHRGKQRIGQYFAAFPNHAVELDKPVDAQLAAVWLRLAETINLPTKTLAGAATRGDFIRAAWTVRTSVADRQGVTVNGDEILLDGQPVKLIGLRCSNALISEKTTDDLIAALEAYQSYGINTLSVFLMGSRFGDVKGYLPDATLDPIYRRRLKKILMATGERKMVTIVGCLYWSTSKAKEDLSAWTQEDANRAIANTARWLAENDFTHVILDPDNEGMAVRTKKWSAEELIRSAKEASPRLVVANNTKQDPPNEDLNMHFGKAEAGKPWLDSEATPDNAPGGYWGRFSKQTHQANNAFGNYSRIGRYTDEMKQNQLKETRDELRDFNGYVFASTWLQCGAKEGVDGPFTDVGGLSSLGSADDSGAAWNTEVDAIHPDASIRWWLDFVKQNNK